MSDTPLLDTFYTAETKGPKLVIGLVHGGTLDAWFGISLSSLLSALGKPQSEPMMKALKEAVSEVIHVRSGPALQLGRGILTNTFMEKTDADALLMIDSDMSFEPGLIAQHWDLFNQKLPNGSPIDVLGGLAFIASAPRVGAPGSIQPNIWAKHPQFPDKVTVAWSYPQNSLIEVGNTGAACVMIRRKVFEAIPMHHFHHIKMLNYELLADKFASCTDPTEIEEILRVEAMNADEYGEDMSFCMRARYHGFPLYMHTALKYGHSKNILLTEEDYIASQKPVVDAQAEGES